MKFETKSASRLSADLAASHKSGEPLRVDLELRDGKIILAGRR